jgi:isochorismate synthase
MTSPATAPGLPGSAGAPLDWLVRSLTEGLNEANVVVAWLPCSPTGPERAFALAPSADRTAWIGTDGNATVGAGVAVELHATGEGRFRQMQEQIETTYDSLLVVASDGARALDPRLHGGFAFHPGSADRVPWNSFGDARFVLPRLLYRQDDGHAQIGLAVSRRSLGARPLLQQVHDLAEWGDSLRSPRSPSPSPAAQVRAESSGDLRERIERAVAATRTRRLDKVVVANCQLLDLTPAPDPAVILARLVQESPTATTFAFDCSASCFLGASPERLVLRRQREVSSEALAGSIRLVPDLDASRLLDSTKDRSEHAFVVRAITAALEPLCGEVQAPQEPVLRTLHRVAHLSTPIVGQLRSDTHVLELVRRLHPTPAVGGSPADAALAWIQQNEPQPRGWYAGPVGWVDANGDGDFVVALRSGAVWGNSAMLFAGAGVVRGSTPDTEVAEIDLKLATFRSAVGASSR